MFLEAEGQARKRAVLGLAVSGWEVRPSMSHQWHERRKGLVGEKGEMGDISFLAALKASGGGQAHQLL